MPLIGLVNPSNYERKHDKPGRLPVWMPLEEVREVAADPNPKWGPWTLEMVDAVMGEYQERGDRISTTTITGGDVRAEIIKRKVDFVDTLDNLYVPLRGTMVHRTLEQYARAGAIAEHGFATTIDDIDISCSPDLLTPETIFDYKVPIAETGVPSFGSPFRHQTEQLMVNAFIVRHSTRWYKWDDAGEKIDNPTIPFDPREFPAKHAVIVYIGPRSPKVIMVERSEEFITPKGAKKKAKRPLIWNDEEVLAFLRPRLHIVRAALDVFPEWPDPWTDPETGVEHTFEGLFGGGRTYTCSGPPLCKLPDCLARRYPDLMVWENPREDA